MYIISQSGEVFIFEAHFSIRQSFQTEYIYCEGNASNINYVFLYSDCIQI